ncbi:hypothetical protein HNR77_004245 [Paenibacillus sp. JGP012]|uniref:hypothetical protein n=1 Tax=Paenibacillus sp. JGP012 TaxID=2735914 RepID=UPI0016143D25|nr:hypothetical protein [Paenibacillus sp. JGP012]MBB6023145.1 hypothetical protein [Paenibacillus sp. JGP012]
MRKFLKTMMLATIVFALVSSSQVSATSLNKSKEAEELQQRTNLLLEQSAGLNQEERIKELEKLGWEIESLSQNDNFSLRSSPGDGKIKNYSFKDARTGTYLVQALWDFNDHDKWERGVDYAYDIVALAVTDEYGRAVNAQGTNGGIVVQDKDYRKYNNGGSLYSYQDSGATFTFSKDYLNGFGMHGYAYFYISKPTSGKSYYVKSQWLHNWTNFFPTTLTNLTLKYPFEVSASFTSTPYQWGTSDQISVSFN